MNINTKKFKFTFILEPEFPINSYILATEALRIANQYHMQKIFLNQLISEKGKRVRSSNGMWFETDGSLDEIHKPDFIFLFSSNLPTQKKSKKLLSVLREFHHNKSIIVAIDTAAFILAQAGLINKNTKITLHWETKQMFLERYPDIEVTDNVCAINGNIHFCSGGIAMLDYMIKIITNLKGPLLAKEISDALIHKPRNLNQSQKSDETISIKSTLCQKAISIMEQNIEFPITISNLAKKLNISIRTLERQFLKNYKTSPIKFYIKIRLKYARNFLFYEDYKINDIAHICGFHYNSIFINAFVKEFNKTPTEFRKYFRKQQNSIRQTKI